MSPTSRLCAASLHGLEQKTSPDLLLSLVSWLFGRWKIDPHNGLSQIRSTITIALILRPLDEHDIEQNLAFPRLSSLFDAANPVPQRWQFLFVVFTFSPHRETRDSRRVSADHHGGDYPIRTDIRLLARKVGFHYTQVPIGQRPQIRTAHRPLPKRPCNLIHLSLIVVVYRTTFGHCCQASH